MPPAVVPPTPANRAEEPPSILQCRQSTLKQLENQVESAIREKQEDNGAKDERMNRMDEVVAEATEAIVNNESNNPLLNALDLMKENVGSKEYVVDNVHLIQSAAKRPGASGKILTPLKKQRKW